jgi:hypothetical protein
MAARTTRAKVASRETPAKTRTARSRRDRRDEVSEALRLPFETRIVDGEYITPRAFLRSALFGVTKKGRRIHYESEQLATVGAMRITYTGAALDQHDYDVWMHMVHRAREHGMGPKVLFTLRSFLDDLSWDKSGKSMSRLRMIFDRLFGATVVIEMGKHRFQGHLVDAISYSADVTDEKYYFRLSPEMAMFFAEENIAYVTIEDRKNVRGMLAKWLHAYIVADKSSQPVSIDQLWRLSRSGAARRSTFVQSLRAALDELAVCKIIEPTFKLDAHYLYYCRSAQRAVLPVSA